MRIKGSLLVLAFALTPVMRAQEKPAQASPGPGSGDQMRAEHRQQMMATHKQEMEAVRADIERMKSSLAQMKAIVLTIRDPNELSLWRTNVDMWETVVAHMDRMQKSMEWRGPGMMHGPSMGGPPPTAPAEKKPEQVQFFSFWKTREDAQRHEREQFDAVQKAIQHLLEATPEVSTFDVHASTAHKVAAEKAT